MSILALDLASYKSGYAILNDIGDIRIDSGVISIEKFEIGKRLSIIKQQIGYLIDEHQPKVVIMEDSYESKNPKTAKILNYVHGVVLQMLFERDISHVYYSPTTIKKQLVGDGKASKEQVADAVREYLNDGHEFVDDNESDACAVGVCHFRVIGGGKHCAN